MLPSVIGKSRAAPDFELFRDELERALMRSDRAKGGRPPYDAVLMFQLLVLQTLYTLSDEQAEYQAAAVSRSYASSGSASATRCRTPRRSGSSASS